MSSWRRAPSHRTCGLARSSVRLRPPSAASGIHPVKRHLAHLHRWLFGSNSERFVQDLQFKRGGQSCPCLNAAEAVHFVLAFLLLQQIQGYSPHTNLRSLLVTVSTREQCVLGGAARCQRSHVRSLSRVTMATKASTDIGPRSSPERCRTRTVSLVTSLAPMTSI